MPFFMEKWVEDKARNRIVREIDLIQSEWPAHTGSALASGFVYLSDCSLLLSVPSSRWFKPRTLVITNENAQLNKIWLYTHGSAGDASASLFPIYINGQDTQFIALDGITIGGDLWVSALRTSIAIRVGGVLLASGPEN